jgi:signal transduction histidine kinase
MSVNKVKNMSKSLRQISNILDINDILYDLDEVILIIGINSDPIIYYYNKKAALHFGWDGHEKIGENLSKINAINENLLLKNYIINHSEVDDSENFPYYTPWCEKNKFIIIWSMKKIKMAVDNNLSFYLLLTGSDITEQEWLRNNSQENQDYLDNIKNTMPGNVYWKDKEGRYIGCNDYLLKMHNLMGNDDTLIGKTDYDLFSKEMADNLRENDKIVMDSGQAISFEESIQLSDQQIRTYLVNKAPLKNKYGKTVGVVGNSIEITEIKNMQIELVKAKEEAEQANFTKTVFMENMSHDFKTPLNGIYGMVQIMAMRSDELPDDLKELIEVQEKSILRLKKLIDSILDFDKLYSGKIKLEDENINLLEIIESVVHNLSFLAKNKKINLVVNYSPSLPRHFIGDTYCVTSIILNLLNNAVKFTDSGCVSIDVSVIQKDGEDAELSLSVADTGIGIPAEKLQEIFDRFHRLELSNTGVKEGHGIGLAAVKELVEKLGGKINVQSELNKGSIFTVTLPIKVQEITLHLSNWQKQYSSIRILVVSDEKTSTDIIFNQMGSEFVKKVESKSLINELLKANQAEKPYSILIIDDDVQFCSVLVKVRLYGEMCVAY